MKELSVREWQVNFVKGLYDATDRSTQCDAGWYDWFCRDTSLANKTKAMGKIIKQVKDGGKVNLDTQYVWFKNNCPMSGPLYDDFRFAERETGDVQLTIQVNDKRNDKRYTVYGAANEFQGPLFACTTSKELVKWLNTK